MERSHLCTHQEAGISPYPIFVEDVICRHKLQSRSTGRVCAHKTLQMHATQAWEEIGLDKAMASLEQITENPSVEQLMRTFKTCGSKERLAVAELLVKHIQKHGLEAHENLGHLLIPMLVEVGSKHDVEHIFRRLEYQDEGSWSALIQGYVESGQFENALNLYRNMQEHNVHPTRNTLLTLLKACARLKCLETGCQIHTEMAKKGYENSLFVASTLVDMFAKCGALVEAREVFDMMPGRDVVSWNALISGYAEHGLGEEALRCLRKMQLDGVFPSAVTFVCSLKACGSLVAIDKGRELHAEVVKEGFESSLFVGNAIVDMYAKCHLLSEAQQVFKEMAVRDVVSWTTLITGYTEGGLGEMALSCFEQMQLENVPPNVVTFVCSLKSCGRVGAIDRGQQVYAEIVKEGFEKDSAVGNTLVDLYAKYGFLTEAQDVFDNLSTQNIVSWNALIAGYAEHGLGDEALRCLEQMQYEGLPPNEVTFFCCLKACGCIGAIGRGQVLHDEIAEEGYERDPFVGSSLVDMYSKCGALVEAQEVFHELPARDVVSWTAVISGYACQGESEIVSELFERMGQECIQPDEITCLNLLAVCSHAGLVEKGQSYFKAINKDYGIRLTIEHHNCMIDLLTRAGQLDEAVAMLEKMPFQPDLMTCYTILAACRRWGDVELGRHAFECAVSLDKKHGALFILLSNMYADVQLWEG